MNRIASPKLLMHEFPPWDLAGVEGLAVAKQLFGEAATHLAPFQSFETTFEGEPCGVLRPPLRRAQRQSCDRRPPPNSQLGVLFGTLETEITP